MDGVWPKKPSMNGHVPACGAQPMAIIQCGCSRTRIWILDSAGGLLYLWISEEPGTTFGASEITHAQGVAQK